MFLTAVDAQNAKKMARIVHLSWQQGHQVIPIEAKDRCRCGTAEMHRSFASLKLTANGVGISQNKFNCSSKAWTGHFVAKAEPRSMRVILYLSRRRVINCDRRLA
jgi:hypothetical protein